MNIKTVIAIATLATFATGAALAQGANDIPSDRPLTRAEVIADLEIYIESGLRDLGMQEDPELGSPRYEAARARYAALRLAPTFAARVQQIAQQRGEAALVSRIADTVPKR